MEQPLAKTGAILRENRSTVRGIAVSAALGGILLVAYAIMMSIQPPGCIADECIGRTHRVAGPVEMLLLIGAVVLTGVTAIGLSWMHRPGINASKTVRIAAMIAGVSLLTGFALGSSALYAVGIVVLLASMVAFVFTGVGLMESRSLPSWAGAALILGSLSLFVFNDQNQRVLFAIPFAVAWLVLGVLLWASAGRSTKRSKTRVQPIQL